MKYLLELTGKKPNGDGFRYHFPIEATARQVSTMRYARAYGTLKIESVDILTDSEAASPEVATAIGNAIDKAKSK